MIVPYSTDKTDNFIGYGAVGIIAMCLVGFLLTWPAQRTLDHRLQNDSLRVWMQIDTPEEAARKADGISADEAETDKAPPDVQQFLKSVAMPASNPAALEKRFHAVQVRESPLFRFGFHPASGRWIPGIVTYQFLHAGLLHLLGNLIFFFAFGVAIERRYGLNRFLVFYLVAGMVAALCQVGVWAAFHPGRLPPSTLVGASGSIAAVMGAYMRVYPGSNVKVFVWLFRPRLGQIPAWVFLGFWIALEIVRGWAFGSRDETGGTAYMAHVGGFAFGFLVAPLLPLSDELKAEIAEERQSRPQGVSISFGNAPVAASPTPPPDATMKPWVDQAMDALARNDLEEATRLFQRQIQSWLRGDSLDHESIANLVLRLERDHPQVVIDPLVLWECGMKLHDEPRNAEAARSCLRKVVGPESVLPDSLRSRGREVLARLDDRALPPGLEVPLALPGTLPARPATPGATGSASPWRVD